MIKKIDISGDRANREPDAVTVLLEAGNSQNQGFVIQHMELRQYIESRDPRLGEYSLITVLIKKSSYIRDIVFGFGDGINTSLGIVAGVGGAQISADVVILAALVGMFTGAKAMAVQNYLAVKSQREILQSEIKREEFEIENLPNKERQEIVDIYTAKGFE